MSLNNQFVEHPLLENTITTLGSGVTLVKDAATAGDDYLLVPPPPVAAAGDLPVSRLLRDFSIINTTGAEILAAVPPAHNFRLVYKTATQEIILPTNADDVGLVAGASRSASIDIPFLIRPTDRGLFLRITAVGVTGLTAHCTFDDIRRIDQVATNLTDVSQTVLSGRTNTVRKIPRSGEEFEHFFMTVANADSVDHNVDLSLNDGTDTILVSSVLVPAGECAELFAGGNPPSLLSGWSYTAVLQEAIATQPCTLFAGYTDVNLHPVRQDQGGAY